MNLVYTDIFKRNYKKLPKQIQKQFHKQIVLFLENSKHPSLHTKKMEGYSDIWEGRVTRGYRFTFKITGDHYILRRIGSHDILRNP